MKKQGFNTKYSKYRLRRTVVYLWANVKRIRYGYLVPLVIAFVVWFIYPFDFLFDSKYTAKTTGTVTHVQTKKGMRQSQYKGNYEYISAYIISYHFMVDTQVFYQSASVSPHRINAQMWRKFKNQLNQNVFQIKYNPENPEQSKLVFE